MGGYVGEQGFTLFVDPEGNIKVGMISDLVSSCIDGEHVPVNPELLAARPNMPANSVAAAPSIADELKKLAELRDLGVLTPEEFEKQKAKLLNE